MHVIFLRGKGGSVQGKATHKHSMVVHKTYLGGDKEREEGRVSKKRIDIEGEKKETKRERKKDSEREGGT